MPDPRTRNLASLAALALLLVACGKDKPAERAANKAPRAAAGTGDLAPAASEPLGRALKVKSGDGKLAFKLKPKADGAKVEGPDGALLARLKVDGAGKTKVKDKDGGVLGFLTFSSKRYKVKDAEQQRVLFGFQYQDDGDGKLETGDGELIVKLKVRDYGIKAVDKDEVVRFKVKRKGDKTSVRDASDKTLWYTKSPISPMAAAILGLRELSVPMRAALLVQVDADRR